MLRNNYNFLYEESGYELGLINDGILNHTLDQIVDIPPSARGALIFIEKESQDDNDVLARFTYTKAYDMESGSGNPLYNRDVIEIPTQEALRNVQFSNESGDRVRIHVNFWWKKQ